MNADAAESRTGPSWPVMGAPVDGWHGDLEKVFANAHTLARVFVDSPVGLALSYGDEYRFRFVNEAFCRILGRSRAEIVGRNATELGLFDGQSDVRTRARQAFFADGVARDIPVRVPLADGTFGYALLSATASLPGEPASGVTAIVDITDREQAAEARRLIDARFAALVSQSRDLLILMDERLDIIFASPSVYEALGASPETAPRALTFRGAMPDDLYRASAEVIRDSAATGRPGRFTSELRAADGSRRIYDMLFDNRLHDPAIRAIVATGRDITDREEAARALRRLDERFTAYIRQTSDLLLFWDAMVDDYTFISPSVFRALGIEEQLPTQVSIVEMCEPDSAARARAAGFRCHETGEPQQVDVAFIDATGRTRWFDTRFTNHEADPAIAAIVVAGREITDRREAEQALRQLDARFSAIIAGSPDIHVIVDHSLAPTFLSPSTVRFLGVAPGAPLTDDVLGSQPPEELAALTQALATVRDTGGATRTAYRGVDADGRERWFDLVITNSLDEPVIGGIVIVGRDITEQRAADEAVRLRDRALNAMSLGYVVTDPSQARAPIVAVNPAFSRITGYSREELVGMSGLRMLGPDSDRSVIADLRAAVEGGADPVYRLRVYRKSGEPYWMELHTAPVNDADGKLTHHVTTIEDITPRILAEQELRTSAMLLDQAPAAVFGLTGDGVVTHWNRAAEDLFGTPRAAAIGAPLTDVVGPAASRHFLRALVEIAAVGQPWTGELRLSGPSGSDRLVQVTTTPVDDLSGRGAGCIAVVVDITERFRAEQELQRLALSDPLTGLANRTRFIDRLGVALNVLDADEHAAVLLVDIDDFRRFNEALGHAAGDDALRLLARRLADEVGGRGLVARFSGDRFAVMLDRATLAEAEDLAAALSARAAEPIVLHGRPRYVTASIGMTLATAGSDAWTVVNECDVAERQATRQGTTRVTRFEPGMGVQARWRLELETDIRRALDEGQFRLVYQPLVDLASGRLVSAESLIRWEHPERGPVAPGEFIPFAEETGLIVPIGAWVIEAACAMLRRLQDLHPGVAGPGIDVNLSPRQFRHDSLVADVAAAITRSGVAPARLGIEVTETAASKDAGAALAVLGGLHALGVQLALDDFGAGYSSLGLLDRWPVQGLKLDRSLVGAAGSDVRRAAIARAVTTLGHDLGMTITAEGIEIAEQAAAMARLGCNRGQGYHFARPMTADALAAAVAADPFPRFPNLR